MNVPNTREYLGEAWYRPWYRYTIDLDPADQFVLPAGDYFVMVRPYTPGTVGQSFWLTSDGNAGSQSESYFRSDYFGYPDWVPGTSVFGAAHDVTFVLYGDTGGGGLEAFVDDYPASVQRGTALGFTAGVTNTGGDPAAFDQALLDITGPASLTKSLYSGADITLNPGQTLAKPISLRVPQAAPLGWYYVEVQLYLDGGFIDSAGFEVEVVN